MEDNIYDLKKAWNEMADNHLVQSVSLNPEYENEFNYQEAKNKLDKLYTNITGDDGTGNTEDSWYVTGEYPFKREGQSAIIIFSQKSGENNFVIMKSTFINDNVENEEITSGSLDEVLAKAQEIKPSKSLKEVDSPDEAIARRVKDETPSNTLKTIKLDGSIADLLDREMRETGNNEWTDGFQGNGPYLPKEVEAYVMKVVGNATEEPFKVRFVKYGSSSPLEGRGAPLFVEYEQETSPSHEFGNRDMDESVKSPIDTVKNLVKVIDNENQVFIYFGIFKIGMIEQTEEGEWDIYVNSKPLVNPCATKEEAIAKFVEYMSE